MPVGGRGWMRVFGVGRQWGITRGQPSAPTRLSGGMGVARLVGCVGSPISVGCVGPVGLALWETGLYARKESMAVVP